MQRSKEIVTANDYFVDGCNHLKRGHLNTAISHLSKAIDLNPDDPAYYNIRGNIYFNIEQFDKAHSDYNKAISLNPNKADYYFNRGSTFGNNKQFNEALADYNKAISLNPNEAYYYYGRGKIFDHYLYQDDEALADYNKAISLNPNEAKYYFRCGLLYSRKNNIAKTIENYIHTIALAPTHTVTLFMLSKALARAETADLPDIKKPDLFNIIKSLLKRDQIHLFKKCIDENTVLGNFFWKQDGLTKCSLTNGTLKDICAVLKKLDPEFVPFKTQTSSNTFFHDASARKKEYPDMNPVTNDDMFQL